MERCESWGDRCIKTKAQRVSSTRKFLFCFWNPVTCKSVRSNTNTDVSSDAADVEIGDLFLSDQLLHVGCAQFLVVKEGGVGINVGVETLLDGVALGVDLGTKVVCSLKIL